MPRQLTHGTSLCGRRRQTGFIAFVHRRWTQLLARTCNASSGLLASKHGAPLLPLPPMLVKISARSLHLPPLNAILRAWRLRQTGGLQVVCLHLLLRPHPVTCGHKPRGHNSGGAGVGVVWCRGAWGRWEASGKIFVPQNVCQSLTSISRHPSTRGRRAEPGHHSPAVCFASSPLYNYG